MGKGMNPEQVARTVGNVTVTLLDTGEVFDRTPRQKTRCVFVFDLFPTGEYMVQLRLDFGDLDERGNPTLDADFIDPATGEHDHSMKGHPAHQTKAEEGSGSRTYPWEFKGVSVPFTAAITWQLSTTTKSTTDVSITPSVARATVTHEDGTTD